MSSSRVRPKWQRVLFGKSGGWLNPQINSPWGYIIIIAVTLFALFKMGVF